MAATAIKLESFISAKAQAAPEPLFTREELEQTRAEAFEEGKNQSRGDEVGQLCAGLERLAQSLDDNLKLRNKIRCETTEAVAPLLSGVIETLAPLNASPRITEALTAELKRLAKDAQPINVRIACNAQLDELVKQCIAEAGLSGIELDETESDRISLSFSGGEIEFSNEKIAQGIKELIEEILENPDTWTTQKT